MLIMFNHIFQDHFFFREITRSPTPPVQVIVDLRRQGCDLFEIEPAHVLWGLALAYNGVLEQQNLGWTSRNWGFDTLSWCLKYVVVSDVLNNLL